MTAIFWLIDTVLGLYSTIVIIWVIMSWLIMLNVVPYYHPLVQNINALLNALIEPVLNPIRRFMPAVGGFDLSPIVLLLGIYFLRIFLMRDIAPLFGV